MSPGSRFIFFAITALLGLVQPQPGEAQPLRLAAAASLGPALTPWADDTGVTLHLAATGVLVQQLVAGAPVDAVILADPAWLTPLTQAGWCDPSTAVTLAGNTLVIAGRGPPPHVDAPGAGALLEALGPGARVVIGDPSLVALGRYARQSLKSLNLWDLWSPRLLRAPDAPAAAAWVQRGAADAAVLYRTDVPAGGPLHAWLAVDASTHAPIRYVAVAAADSERGRALITALQGDGVHAALAAHGFAAADADPGPAPAAAADRHPDPSIARALVLSLGCALAAVLLAAPPAVLLAWGLSRPRPRGRIRRALRLAVEAAVLVPIIVPPVVVGYVLLTLAGPDALGTWSPVFSWRGAALAQAVVALPFWVIALRAALVQINPDVLDAARCDGAAGFALLRRVALPLAAPGLLAGGLLAFARALGEFGATLVVAGNIEGETRTVPLAIYTALQTPGGGGAASALVLVAVGLACAAAGVAALLRGGRG